MANKKDKSIIPPSLQPRKVIKKIIPGPQSSKIEKIEEKVRKTEKVSQIERKVSKKEIKERFTLWLNDDVYKAFKIHTATRKGSGSDYIENLIKKDLGL